MSADFRFKQFNITQQLSAMKVGTDGVLSSYNLLGYYAGMRL